MMFTVLLAVGIPVGYMLMSGVIYGPSDNMPRFLASIFWPLTGPLFVGILAARRIKKERVQLPKATARSSRAQQFAACTHPVVAACSDLSVECQSCGKKVPR